MIIFLNCNNTVGPATQYYLVEPEFSVKSIAKFAKHTVKTLKIILKKHVWPREKKICFYVLDKTEIHDLVDALGLLRKGRVRSTKPGY